MSDDSTGLVPVAWTGSEHPPEILRRMLRLRDQRSSTTSRLAANLAVVIERSQDGEVIREPESLKRLAERALRATLEGRVLPRPTDAKILRWLD